MKRQFTTDPSPRRRLPGAPWWRRAVDRVALVAVGVALPLAVMLVYYTVTYHRALVSVRWPVGAYVYDPALGYRLAAGVSMRLRDGAFHHETHALGYRVPAGAGAQEALPGGVLALGGSFTYGDEVEAEQTFSFLLGHKLGLPAYNFGVPAYSYATMILLARDLARRGVLDRLRPSVAVLGAGDWLIPRSFNPFMPSEDLQYAYPYLSADRGRLEVRPAPRRFSLQHLFRLQDAYFPDGDRDVALTPWRFLLLAREVPRVLYANLLGNRQRRRLSGGPPVPSSQVYTFVLRELTRALGAHTPLVVLWMPTRAGQGMDPGLARATAVVPGVLLVSGRRALDLLRVPEDQYCCGHHPQPAAHRAYAVTLARRITAAGLLATDRRPDAAAPSPGR